MKKIFKGKIKLLIGLTFLALFIFNTIAYSGLATKLAITSEAMFRPNVDIRITNIKLHSAENGAVESYSPKYNVDSTTTGFVLPNTSSKITYEVTVTNYGNVRQTIYKFIKNSISTDGVNIEISNFKPVYSDTSSDYNCTTDGTTANKNCTYKNSDFTIVSNKNYDDDKENEKVFYITFSTTNPNGTPKNVIENYKYKPVYKIDFNANGGQNAPSSIYKVFGESTSLPKETPTRSLYNFTGWSKSSTSTSAEYSAGGLYDLSEDESNIKNIKDVTLYAVWQKKQATIDLNYNIDGTWYYAGYNNKIQTGIKVNGEDKGYLNDFSGIYDYGTSYEIYGFKIDGVTIPYSKKYTVDGTNHLDISFNTINFKVNDTNLGSVTPIQLIVIPGTTYKVSNNVITLSDGRIATASPKTITGYISKFSSYTITPNSTTINTKITATANFTKEVNTYTITLDNKSATTAGTTAIYGKYGAGIYLDSALKNVMTTTTNKITVPAKTGYTFKGYYTKENGQGDQIINENGYITDKITNTTYTTNVTLYAYYTATTYTVIYNSNGGTGTMANDTATYDSNFITTKNTFAKTGYTFNGWNEKTDGTGTVWGLTTSGVYESGKSWKWTYTKNITLYAQWKVNSYTLTVNPNGGTWNNSTSASTITQNYGTTYTLANPTKPGYTFTGWTLSGKGSLSGSTYTFADGAGTLTANYTESNYIVTYDATTNGGSTAKQTASTKYKSSVDLTKKAEKSGYEFVGWNTNKDATSVLSSYEMPANDVTLYAIYKKELSATFNYYNSKSETKSVTIYNKATSGSITSPAALGTPNGYTFRHYSTSNAANAAKTIDANSAVILTSNQTYYASYQKNVTAKIYYSTLTATDYVYSGASQTSVDVTAVKYLGYTGVEVDSIYTVPTAVTSSTGGASAEKYLGVSNKVSDATVITPTTANTSYYAVYTESITFHYYNGTAHTKTILTRRMLSNGSSYSNSLSDSEPVVSNYDGASKTAWSYDPNHYESSYIITSLATGTNNLYAIYTKPVTATFNYYDGSKAATTTASSNKYYVSKDSGINTFNTNITIPDAAKASRGSYTYRGISTSNAANASVVTPTTANTTYYSSYTYAITANFTANGGTGTAPSAVAGTGYMNYSGSKIGISVTMPSNAFTRNGYTFGGWYDAVSNKTYAVGTSVTVDSSRNYNATWNVVTYTIKYNLNGGTVSATNPTSYKVTDADITLNNPTKPGYTFTGWTGTGLSEASKAVTIKSGSYGNREYTANYSINQYYYDVNPDSGIKSFDITIDGKTSTGLTDYYQKLDYGKEATITNVVAKTGYTYTGYNTTGSMTILTGSTNSNIKTKLGTGNGYIALTSTAKTLKFDAQTLTSIKYSTTPQALVFKGADNGTGNYSYAIKAGNTNGYFTINGTTITTSDKVVPPVGTYKLTVTATDNTSKVTATADITIVIEKVSSTNPTLTAYSGTYDGQQHTIGVTGGSGGTIQYSIDNKTWSTTKPTRIAQGTTTVYVKVVGDSNHTDTNPISSTITIKPATITYTANSFDDFYDGNAHSIMVNVTKPTSGATITYSLTENGTYSTTKPTVTNATTTPVTVYFKILASNYNSVSSKATITINKTNSVSPTLTAYSGTYDGKPHTIGVIGGSGGTIKYSTDQTNWSTTLPKRTDATPTPVTVYVKVFGDGNHKDTSIISSTITINKKTDVITMSSISTNYTGKKVEATATAESKTTITYTYYNGTTCSGTALSSAPVNAGDYSVKATSTGNNNYKSNSACATIKISNTNNPTTVSAVAGLKYGSTSNLVTTSNVQGTIYYSVGTELTSSNYKTSGSTSIPTASGKNAYTYKIYYYVDATGTNYESTKGGPVSVTISKADGSISYATKSVTKDYGNASFVNALTKTGDGTVGYSSSNTGVATIDASGKVTIIAAGTTTITAKVTDGTNYIYATKTATYTLTVNKIENTVKVSSVTGIIYGDSKAMVSATGVQGTIYYSTETELTEANYLSKGSQDIPSSYTKDSGYRNAGTYNIYYYITGNENYYAASNTSSTPIKTTISTKSVMVTWGTTPLTYNGKEQAPSASVTTGITGETMTVTRTTGTNAGDYTSTASCSSVAGGQKLCKNYTLTGNTKAFSIGRVTLPAPTNIKITTAGIVTWSGVSNASSYQISMDNTNWTAATSGVDYLSKLIASTGSKTVYVRAVGTGNYKTDNEKSVGTASTTVYTVTINSNSTTRGKVDTSSYNVIEGATYSTSSNKLSFIGVTTGTTTKTLKTVTATPSTGYYFANWSSASGSISSNATITANFVIIDYKIKYENGDASSGTLPSEQTTHYNETVTLEKNNMSKNQTNLGIVTFNYNGCGNNTTGTGYTTYVPNGWATSNNGTKAYDSGASIKWTRTSNLTLYPSWTSTNHSATFPAPTCTGYTFDGWYTAASGGSKVTSYVGSSAITYYAHWKSNIYELLLNNKKLNDNKTIYLKYGDGVYLNYANNSVSNKMTSTANPISKPKLTKDIPLFSNYIVPKEGEEDKNVPTGTSTVSFTFDGYSYKNSDSQRIKLINSDGYIADTFTNKLFTSNSVADLDIKSLQYNFGTPTKAGYTFEGWFTRPQGDSTTNVLYVPEASGSGNDHNFLENNTDKVYAHWLKNIELVSSNSDWSSSGVTISPKEISKSDSVEGASSETAKIKYQYCLAELGQTCTNYSDIDDINGSITINENGIHDIYYRAVSMFLIKNNSTDSEAITKTIVTPSVKTTVKIDNVQPEVDIVAKKVSTNQVVKSGDWSNDFLKFQFSNIKIGSSGGVIKYCIQNPSTNDSESDSESNDCEPNKLADSSNMISLSETNTKDGKYEIVYKIINSAGEESEIGKYNANIDRVAPVVTINQTNLDDDTSASPITSPNEQKLDSGNNFTRTFSQNYTTWVKSGYDFKVTVSGESDYQIRVGYNDPDLLSTDLSYKKIPELSEQEDITESGEFSLIENGYRYGVVTVTDAAGNKTTFVFYALIDDVVPILDITAKDQKGNEIPSGILSKTGLTYTTKIIKSGVSPVKVYSCSVTAADFDPDNLCTPESPVGTGRTGNEFVQKGYANVTSMDRYVRVQGTSSSGLQSEVEADNGIEEGETGREEYNTIHYGRVGTTDIEISVYRTDNSKAVTSRKWVNSKIKFKLTPVSSTSTFKYCTGAGDIKDSGTTKCTPKTAGTTNKLVSSTRTGKFHIAYQATTGGKPGTIHYFNAYVDVVKPTLKITAYKLNSAGNGADGGALTSATNGGPDNLSGNNIKGGAWRDYYYFFSLSGSGDTGGSGIKSMVWEYNNARRYSDDTTTKKLTGKSSYTDKKVHNISFKSSGLRYGKVTLTDNAGNKVSMTITVYIDRIKQNLVLRLYSYSNGKKGDKVLKTVTETNYSTNKWVNHAYYFDVSSSTGGSPLTVTLQVNAAGAMTSNRDLIDPVYPLVNSSGKPTGHSVAASGNRYVRVIAYDRTHKDTPTVKNVRVYIDTVPPTLTWGDSSVASDGTLKINYTCKDTLSRLKDANGNATSSLTKTATLQSTGPAKGVCVDRAGNKTTSYSSTHYYSESSVCGVDYYKCHYEREYLGVKSDSSCVSEGNVCVDSAGFGKCYCYSSGYTKQVCDEPVYNTCWH